MANDNQEQNQVQENQQSEPVRAVPTGSLTLKLQFGTLSGDKTFTYNYANGSADEEDVQALMTSMITNGSIFKYPPLIAKAAWIETKTITEYTVPSA